MSEFSLYNTEPVIRTYTGTYINVFEPNLEDIHIEDIAHGLTMQCRWNGHIPRFYSVAAHSIHCCQLAPPELKLSMLLHDASEAYIGDMPSPIKKKMPEYQKIEDTLMQAIFSKYGLEWPLPDAAHKIDKEVLELEWEALKQGNWMIDLPTFDSDYEMFLEIFNTLTQ